MNYIYYYKKIDNINYIINSLIFLFTVAILAQEYLWQFICQKIFLAIRDGCAFSHSELTSTLGDYF